MRSCRCLPCKVMSSSSPKRHPPAAPVDAQPHLPPIDPPAAVWQVPAAPLILASALHVSLVGTSSNLDGRGCRLAGGGRDPGAHQAAGDGAGRGCAGQRAAQHQQRHGHPRHPCPGAKVRGFQGCAALWIALLQRLQGSLPHLLWWQQVSCVCNRPPHLLAQLFRNFPKALCRVAPAAAVYSSPLLLQGLGVVSTTCLSAAPCSVYQPLQSQPAAGRWIFTYHITITNQSDRIVQLRNRHW